MIEKLKKIFKCFSIVIKGFFIVGITILAAYNINNIFQRVVLKNNMPKFFGYTLAVVVSGSMEPSIQIDDIVIIKEQKNYQVNDVIMYFHPSDNIYITHRIIKKTDEGKYLTQGDNNDTDDKIMISDDAVVGKVVKVVKKAGKTVEFFQSPIGLFMTIAIGLGIWISLDVVSNVLNKSKKEG